jgi:outer membrane protein assembly factor BamB
LCLCWTAILTTPGVMAQQATTAYQSWEEMRQTLAQGKLQIERADGKKITGEMLSVSDTELVIDRKGKPEAFKRDDVKKVWRVNPPGRLKRGIFMGIGGGVGFFAGAAIAIGLAYNNQCGGSCADEKAGIAGALIGLPVAGVLAGKALAGKGKRTLIYSAP